MPIIQDERKRMIAHGDSFEKICNGKCSECTQDERVYRGLIDVSGSPLLGYICPNGLTYGTRIERFCEKNPTDYHMNIVLPAARSLILDSLGNFKPDKIKSDVRILKKYLADEEKIPESKEEAITIASVAVPSPSISLSTNARKKLMNFFPPF